MTTFRFQVVDEGNGYYVVKVLINDSLSGRINFNSKKELEDFMFIHNTKNDQLLNNPNCTKETTTYTSKRVQVTFEKG